MTVPRFLQSSFYFSEDPGIDDTADIITNLTALLVAQTPAWTNPSAGVLKSPVDSAGRFMTITLTSLSATRLQMQVQDQNGITVSLRTFDLIAGPLPTKINYFSGQYHLYIECLNLGAGNGEWLAAMMVDPTDHDLVDLQNYVIGGGTRNSGGAVDGQGVACDQWFMLESGASTLRQRARQVCAAVSLNAGLMDFAGVPQFFPFDVVGVPNGSNQWMGAMYQAYVTDSRVAAGIIKPVAIDNATPAEFRTTIAPASGQGLRLALRVG